MAPSPTGLFHIGSARTALFNYLFTRKHGGKFILRIDDTDKERSKKEYEENILEAMSWLKLDYDEIFRQSERTEIYKKYLEKLLAEDKIYISQESEGERSEVIRFRNPNKIITFHDAVRGDISFDTTELGDFVVAKDTTEPLYHFTSVVDDFEMEITHIIRGEDHISNTPRQILIAEALGADLPIYAHIPLILAPDRSKLSKRHGALPTTDYRDQGYLAEAVTNFLALLGWSPQGKGINEEIFSLGQLIDLFDFDGLQKSGAIFNQDKLDWINHSYIKSLPATELSELVRPFISEKLSKEISDQPDIWQKALPIIADRFNRLSEIKETEDRGELDYFFNKPTLDREKLGDTTYLPNVIEFIKNIPDSNFTAENIKNAIWDFATEKGRKEVLWPMRFALSGLDKSPDPFTLVEILGKEESISRLEKAHG